MESYPKFHNEVGVPIVRIGCREFKCIGDTALASQYRWNGPPVVGAWDRLVRPPHSRRSGLRNEVLKIAKEPLLKARHTVRMMAWRTPKSLNCVPFPQHTSKKDRGTIGSGARLLRLQGASG
jgi:hypothetical protein